MIAIDMKYKTMASEQHRVPLRYYCTHGPVAISDYDLVDNHERFIC